MASMSARVAGTSLKAVVVVVAAAVILAESGTVRVGGKMLIRGSPRKKSFISFIRAIRSIKLYQGNRSIGDVGDVGDVGDPFPAAAPALALALLCSC